MHEPSYFAVGNPTTLSFLGTATQPCQIDQLLLVQRHRHRISDLAVGARKEFWEGWITLGLVHGWKICSESSQRCAASAAAASGNRGDGKKLFLSLLVLTTVPMMRVASQPLASQENKALSFLTKLDLLCNVVDVSCMIQQFALVITFAPENIPWGNREAAVRKNVWTGWACCFSQTLGGAFKWCFALSICLGTVLMWEIIRRGALLVCGHTCWFCWLCWAASLGPETAWPWDYVSGPSSTNPWTPNSYLS